MAGDKYPLEPRSRESVIRAPNEEPSGNNMGTNDKVENCGRCSMTTAVDISRGQGTNPWDGDRIEVDEREIKAVSHHIVALGKIKDRLNEWATDLTYGR